MSERLSIALIGAGHLGGSFALALKEAGTPLTITAYDTDAAQPELLKERGGIDAVAASIANAVKGADIVMLATPVRTYRTIAQQLAPHVSARTIITDLGSVKHSMSDLASLLPAARLVPGHPIAGGEKTGAAVAKADLFKGRICILTPAEGVDADAIESIETLWHLTGADVLRMPTQVHDQVYGYVSHLPHLIAFTAAEALFNEGVQVKPTDAMLQQFLRISRSNPRMWTDIFLENREALLPALGTYIALLKHFAKELASGEPGEPSTEAATRFMPRILASSLISAVSLYEQQASMDLRPFGGAGMRDIVAPAAVDPEQEFEAISKAAGSVAASLNKAIPLFRTLENLIGAEDEPGLFAAISSYAAHAHALISPRQ